MWMSYKQWRVCQTFSAPADIVMTRYQAASVMGRAYNGPIGQFSMEET